MDVRGELVGGVLPVALARQRGSEGHVRGIGDGDNRGDPLAVAELDDEAPEATHAAVDQVLSLLEPRLVLVHRELTLSGSATLGVGVAMKPGVGVDGHEIVAVDVQHEGPRRDGPQERLPPLILSEHTVGGVGLDQAHTEGPAVGHLLEAGVLDGGRLQPGHGGVGGQQPAAVLALVVQQSEGAVGALFVGHVRVEHGPPPELRGVGPVGETPDHVREVDAKHAPRHRRGVIMHPRDELGEPLLTSLASSANHLHGLEDTVGAVEPSHVVVGVEVHQRTQLAMPGLIDPHARRVLVPVVGEHRDLRLAGLGVLVLMYPRGELVKEPPGLGDGPTVAVGDQLLIELEEARLNVGPQHLLKLGNRV